MTVVKLVIWIMTTLLGMDYVLQMISSSSTIEVILGVILCILIWAVAIRTNCFMNINFKRKKDEKSI